MSSSSASVPANQNTPISLEAHPLPQKSRCTKGILITLLVVGILGTLAGTLLLLQAQNVFQLHVLHSINTLTSSCILGGSAAVSIAAFCLVKRKDQPHIPLNTSPNNSISTSPDYLQRLLPAEDPLNLSFSSDTNLNMYFYGIEELDSPEDREEIKQRVQQIDPEYMKDLFPRLAENLIAFLSDRQIQAIDWQQHPHKLSSALNNNFQFYPDDECRTFLSALGRKQCIALVTYIPIALRRSIPKPLDS